MFKGKIGFDPELEVENTEVLLLNTSQGNDYVAYGNRNYSTSTSYAGSEIRTTDNLKNLTVTGNEIFIKADVTTEYNQTYRGHVNIGNNGSNGTIRSLISLDPTISFYGKELPKTSADGSPGVTDYKYTFDDESSEPTHTLILKAKGYCYVGVGVPGSCGESGNIRKALDTDGLPSPKVLYNSFKPLLNLITDNETMLFPGPTYNYININLNNLALPASSRGVTDGSRNTTESSAITTKEFVNYKYSLRQNETPVINPVAGTPPGTRGFVAGAVGRVASSSDAKSITAFIPVKNNLSGDVVIGNVSASFIDSGTSSSPVSSSTSNTSAKCKAETKAECK